MTDMTPEPGDRILFTPGVDVDTGEGFVSFTWGDQTGHFSVDTGREAALALLETSLEADLQAAMYQWLLEAPNATPAGAAKILHAFRSYRAGANLADTDAPFTPEPVQP